MPECRPQRGAFETWILCSGVEISAFTGGAATECGGPLGPKRKKPNKYRYIPPAAEGMLDIAMQACQASSEGFRMWKIQRSCCTSKLRHAEIFRALRFELHMGLERSA